MLPEYLREEVRQDAAQQQVGVSDGEVASLAVAHWTGVRPCGLGTSLHAAGALSGLDHIMFIRIQKLRWCVWPR